jgi:hypothetical protein
MIPPQILAVLTPHDINFSCLTTLSKEDYMCPDNQNDEDQCDSDSDNQPEFEEMMERWGVEPPDAEPLGINSLIEKWCESKFPRPMAAIKELREGINPIEAAAALFAYCYSILSPSFGPSFSWTLEQCLEWHVGQVDQLCETGGRDQQTTQISLEHHQHNVTVCRDLIDFLKDCSAGRFQYPKEQDITATSSYVHVLLAAMSALASLSGEDKQYDPYLCQNLERVFTIIKQGKVLQAQRFSELNLNRKGRKLSGDVEGFLACLGCAAVCFSLAWMKSELMPEHERDYETAFKAYVYGAENMRRTGYGISELFGELFAPESEKGKGGINIYWRIIGAWEKVRKNIEGVDDWRELRKCLEDLVEIMWYEGYDTEFGLYPDTEEPGVVYLRQQISFLEGRLSREDIIKLMDQQKRNQHDKRLQTDFFEGLWQYLEESTKDNIIRAEHRWYDNPTRESHRAAFIDYSNALEIELRYIIFLNPGAEACVTKLIKNRRKKEPDKSLPDLKSVASATLYLSDISKLLRCIKPDGTNAAIMPIVLAISNLPVIENVKPEKQPKALLTNEEFVQDLSYVYQIRNITAHSMTERPILSHLNELRRKILGIGCEGYLIKLAELKKLIRESEHG